MTIDLHLSSVRETYCIWVTIQSSVNLTFQTRALIWGIMQRNTTPKKILKVACVRLRAFVGVCVWLCVETLKQGKGIQIIEIYKYWIAFT